MKYYGNNVSEGIAVGKVFCYTPFQPRIQEETISQEDIPAALRQFDTLRKEAYEELTRIVDSMSREDPEKAKIFSAHQEILEDEELLDGIRDKIETENMSLDWAIEDTFTLFIRLLSKTKDPLIRARIADLSDVKNRLLRLSAGVPEKNLSSLPEDVIVVAHDLLPSDTATIDREHILAIITEIGGETSHSAIIAKSYGIPAILGVSGAMEVLHDAETVIANALSGEIITSPTREECEDADKLKADFLARREAQKKFLPNPCMTNDGSQIEIGMNIGALRPDEEEYLPFVDYIGLFRTEFLYMDSDHMPSEEEQFTVYRDLLIKAGEKPVTLRTLDIGGDKTLPYFELPKEENPFLGNRALRLCLQNKDLFQTQLRAALRASVYGNLWIMFPMVGSIQDIRLACAEVEAAKNSLQAEGIPYREDVKLGIMIEIPSIALMAAEAARYVDFASIGTNDLCQYLSAADRQNPSVGSYYTAAVPAALRLIDHISREFQKNKKPVSVCGEMGGNLVYAPILAGMGIHKLSMNASCIAAVKQRFSLFSSEQLAQVARTALTLESTDAVIDYMNATIEKLV